MGARHRIPELTPEGRAAAEALRRAATGTVSTSPLTRWLYSTDASIYRVVPDVVLVASSIADLSAAAAVAAEYGVPLVARGAASSVAGQAIGPGIAVDCFQLDRILAIDPETAHGSRRAGRDPGVAEPRRRGLRPRVRARYLHGRPGHDRRHGGQQLLGFALDRLRGDQRQGACGSMPWRWAVGRWSSGNAAAPISRAGSKGRERPVSAAALTKIRERYRRTIAADFPRTRRCTSGYNLREFSSRRRTWRSCSPGPRAPWRCSPSSRSRLTVFRRRGRGRR